MKASEVLRRYAAGDRDFSYADLRQADLTAANLEQVNLFLANLAQAVLVGTNLTQASLRQAKLMGANLSQANLSQANLRQANLTGANLAQANLCGANLRRANLTGANLEGAQLDGAILTDAILPDGSVVSEDSREHSLPVPPEPVLAAEAVTLRESIAPVPADFSPQWEQRLTHRRSRTPGWRQVRDRWEPAAWAERVPWIPLSVFGLGYACFGLLLASYNAPFVLWLVVWMSALSGWLGESWVWFVPILAALIIMSAAGISSWTLIIAAAVTISTFCVLKLSVGQSWRSALQGSLWVGGVGVIAMTLGVWIFGERDACGILTMEASLNIVFQSLLLIAGMGLTGWGAMGWLQLRSQGLKLKTAIGFTGSTAALGLLLGHLVKG